MEGIIVTGKIKEIFDAKEVTDKFRKREFVLTTSGNYPQDILLQCTQHGCEMLDAYNKGDGIKAHINIQGKEYKPGKYFTSLNAWKLEFNID